MDHGVFDSWGDYQARSGRFATDREVLAVELPQHGDTVVVGGERWRYDARQNGWVQAPPPQGAWVRETLPASGAHTAYLDLPGDPRGLLAVALVLGWLRDVSERHAAAGGVLSEPVERAWLACRRFADACGAPAGDGSVWLNAPAHAAVTLCALLRAAVHAQPPRRAELTALWLAACDAVDAVRGVVASLEAAR